VVALTNLVLDPSAPTCGSTGAQIHISFNDSGYYSYVGTDALFFGESVTTLNLSGFGQTGNWPQSWVGVARHEIGHMLSMLHEQQHPDVDCGLKPDGEIAQLLGWTLAQVETNFGPIKATVDLLKTGYDPASRMHYQMGPEYFVDGAKSPCLVLSTNPKLSPGDVEFLQLAYPG